MSKIQPLSLTQDVRDPGARYEGLSKSQWKHIVVQQAFDRETSIPLPANENSSPSATLEKKSDRNDEYTSRDTPD